MANTLKQSGAQSATIYVPWINVPAPDPDVNGSVGVLDWMQLPAGKLKTLLNRTYANFDAFFDAASEAGFTSFTLHKNGTAVPSTGAHQDFAQWSLDGEGYPTATVVTLDLGDYFIRIETAYSASA